MKLELVTAIKPDEEVMIAFVKVISILKEIQHGGYCESSIILQRFYEKGISNLDGEISYLYKIGEILGIDFDAVADFDVEIYDENEDDDGLPF